MEAKETQLINVQKEEEKQLKIDRTKGQMSEH